jgi:hypothetical protein
MWPSLEQLYFLVLMRQSRSSQRYLPSKAGHSHTLKELDVITSHAVISNAFGEIIIELTTEKARSRARCITGA